MKISQDTYNEKTFITHTGKSIKGHFVFNLIRSKLQKKFSRKFVKLIPGLKSRPKDTNKISKVHFGNQLWFLSDD